MKNLNTIIFNSDLTVREQTEKPIQAFSSYQNIVRAIVPYGTDYLPFAIYHATNETNDVASPAQFILMLPNGTTTVDGETYFVYEQKVPEAVVASLRATKVEFVLSLWAKTTNFIGVQRYDETAAGYNTTTYIAGELLNDFPNATANDFVRVFNTETDWEFDGTTWSDTGDLFETVLEDLRSEVVEFALYKGKSTGKPTHKPSNTEALIDAINLKVNKSGDTMTGALEFVNANLTRIIMGNNKIVTETGINNTTFDNGDQASDAIKFNDLTTLFTVSAAAPSGGDNWVDTFAAAITAKFAEYQKQADLGIDFLLTNGNSVMTGDLNVGGNSITNVNQVDGVDVSTLKSDFDSHTHTEADITDLDKYTQAEVDAELATKSDVGHTHTEADITDLDKYTQAAADAKFMDKTTYVDGNDKILFDKLPDASKSQTFVQLSTDPKPTENILSGDKLFETDTGDSYIYDGTDWVLMADADWQNVNLDWANVDNTPTTLDGYGITDGATDTELANGLATKSDVGHTHTEADITDLDKYTQAEADATFAAISHTHVEADITDLDKYTQDELLVDGVLDPRYYTETEIDTNLYNRSAVDALLAEKVNLSDLETTLALYPTDTYEVGGTFDGYAQMVVSQSDPRYNDTFVEVYSTDDRTATGTSVITSTDPDNPNIVGQLVADADVLENILADVNINTIGQVKKTAGNQNENPRLRFKMFKSSDLATPFATSGYTDLIDNTDYENVFETAVTLSEVTFAAGERLVIIYEAYTTSGTPIVAIKFGGDDPTRTIVPKSFEATINTDNVLYDNSTSGLSATNAQDAIDELDGLRETHIGDTTNPHQVTATQTGAYTTAEADAAFAPISHTHLEADITDLDKYSQSEVDTLLTTKADLVGGKVPASQLPSYVDDVIEGYFNSADGLFYTDAGFTAGNEIAGETGKVYVDLVTGAEIYRWSGSAFTQIIEAVAFGTVAGTAYEGNAGQALADQITNIINGTTTVGKASQDADGNIIVDTYATKTELSNKTDTLDGIGNVEFNAPANGNFLKFDGSNWVNAPISGLTTISDAPPSEASAGDLWFDSTSLIMYIYYQDGDSLQWVNTQGGVLEDRVEALSDLNNVNAPTPTDSQVLAYNATSQEWEATTPTSAEYYTITIASGDWSGTDPTTAVKTVSGVLATDRPLIDLDLSAVAFADVETKQTEYAKLYRVAATANDQITFYALEAPTESLDILIKVVR